MQTATPVLLTLSGRSQTAPGEEEQPIQLITTGQLTVSGGTYTLCYQESQPEDENGRISTQDITLQMQPGRVIMTRAGEFGTSMVFIKGQRFEGAYHTPYGDLDMAVYATRVSCRLSPEKGSVHLQYQLDMQGAFAAMHDLKLDYVAGDGSSPC